MITNTGAKFHETSDFHSGLSNCPGSDSRRRPESRDMSFEALNRNTDSFASSHNLELTPGLSQSLLTCDSRPKQTITENKIRILDPDFPLDLGLFFPDFMYFSEDKLCLETPEVCYGNVCHGKLWVRDSNRKSAEGPLRGCQGWH